MNLRPVKGMRDLLPEDAIIFEKILENVRSVFRKYGFDPIFTPIVEYWETLKGKYGEEAERKEIWRFKTVWSDVEYGLRYDLTVPLARFYSRFYDKLKLPFKRYQIGRVYRYEEPQKGRMREFWQADFDIIGSETPESDAEILNVTEESIRKIGFEEFEIRINNRRIMDKILEKLNTKDKKLAYNIIDKRYKMSDVEFSEKIREIVEDWETLFKLLEMERFEETVEEIGRMIGYEEVERLMEMYDLLNKKKRVLYDVSIVRGLEYYTGFIFEVFPKNIRKSISSGGRYDELVGVFLGKRIPAVGGSIGISRLFEIGKDLKIFKQRRSYTDIAVVYINRRCFRYAWDVSEKLRGMGYNVYIDLNRKGFREQFEYIDSKGIRYAAIIGEREMKEGKIRIKDRITREEFEIKLERLDEIKELV